MSLKASVHICSFQSADWVTRKTRYEDLRAAVLKAGRYSVFEATHNQWSAAMFMRLDRDPTLRIDREAHGFPWIGVTLKEAK